MTSFFSRASTQLKIQSYNCTVARACSLPPHVSRMPASVQGPAVRESCKDHGSPRRGPPRRPPGPHRERRPGDCRQLSEVRGRPDPGHRAGLVRPDPGRRPGAGGRAAARGAGPRRPAGPVAARTRESRDGPYARPAAVHSVVFPSELSVSVSFENDRAFLHMRLERNVEREGRRANFFPRKNCGIKISDASFDPARARPRT